MKACSHETDALVVVLMVMDTLPHIIKTPMTLLIIMTIIMLLRLKTHLKHLPTRLMVIVIKTQRHLAGAATVIVTIIMMLLVLTDTLSQLFEAVVKTVIVGGEALLRLGETFCLVMLVLLTGVNMLEAELH